MNAPVDLTPYQEIFFDLDGVILDTNSVKRRNISEAVAFRGDTFRAEFVEYFTANNGMPREAKINRHFDPEEARMVLAAYNRLNKESLDSAKPLPGVVDLIRTLHHKGVQMRVFTGGTQEESIHVLERQGLAGYFAAIHGGPATKSQNFGLAPHAHPILMFGDSRSDFEFAMGKGLDFVFVYGYTQFTNWREFFLHNPILAQIPDFIAFTSNQDQAHNHDQGRN